MNSTRTIDNFSIKDIAKFSFLIKTRKNKPITKLQLLQYFSLVSVNHFISTKVLVLHDKPGGVPHYVFRDGLLDGSART